MTQPNTSAIAVIYPPEATAQQQRVALEAVEAKDTLVALSDAHGKPAIITTADEYAEVGSALKLANDKFKFLDEERKITVTPLNDEVKRINDWYRPALDCFKSIRTQAEQMMGTWILKQRREEERLMREAEAAATKVLATTVWRWKVPNIDKLDRRFVMMVVDEKALGAWVKEHGNKDVPAGVEVEEDVGFTVR